MITLYMHKGSAKIAKIAPQQDHIQKICKLFLARAPFTEI